MTLRGAAIAFRVDASPQMGIGHLMRCLTLADALCREGAHVRFISRHLPQHLHDRLLAHGHESVHLHSAPAAPGSDDGPHAHLLGTSAAADADGTRGALQDRFWDWVVVDHYALGAAWETSVRSSARRILAIDDLANRPHTCDVLLDQNHLPDGGARYGGLLPEGCRALIGPTYALLRPEYRGYRPRLRPRPGPARRVLVFFGGTDPQKMTELALRACSLPELRHLALDIVCGNDPERRAWLETQAQARGGVTIHGPRPHLADLMAAADLALGAGGSTTWERMCLGLPSLVITLADNQVAVADWLASEGLIRLVGDAATVTVEAVRDALVEALPRDRHLASIEKGMALSDGCGVARVVSALGHEAGDVTGATVPER